MTDQRYAQHDNTTITPTTTTPTTTTTTSSSSGGSSSGTGARARVRACAREDTTTTTTAQLMHGYYIDCCEYYADTFRRVPAPGIRREIAEHIKGGMTAECIKAIMDETQAAPRPSWAYCRAILQRCDLDNIKTLTDWQRDRQRRESAKNPALNYQQREYKDEDFDVSYFEDLTQYR